MRRIIGNVEYKKQNDLTEPNLTSMLDDLHIFFGNFVFVLIYME